MRMSTLSPSTPTSSSNPTSQSSAGNRTCTLQKECTFTHLGCTFTRLKRTFTPLGCIFTHLGCTYLHSNRFCQQYFKNGDVINAARGYDPSYSWRSMWNAKALLLEGLKWRIGNGVQVRVWDDAWLPGESAVVVPTRCAWANENMTVAEIIDHDEGKWREDLLGVYFTPENAQKIRSIPLSERMPADSVFWWPTVNVLFTVKSAYWLGKMGVHHAARLSNIETQNIWSKIWAFNVPPKLMHFLWRVCSGALAVRGRLVDRHIITSTCCPACQDPCETIIHSLFECHYALSMWTASPWVLTVSSAPRTSTIDMLAWLLEKLGSEAFCDAMVLAWSVWACRNEVVFKGGSPNAQAIAAGLRRMVEVYKQYAICSRRPVQSPVSAAASWTPPSEGSYKINCDASLVRDGEVGCGVIIRAHDGSVVRAAVKVIRSKWTARLAERASALYGLQLARRLGLQRVELEVDAKEMVDVWRNGSVGRIPEDLPLEDIASISSSFELFKFSHVKRGANCVAHFLARLIPSNGNEVLFVDALPPGVSALVDLDLI